MFVTDDEFSITYGSGPETASGHPNTANKVAVGIVTAGCAGVVGAASARGNW